MWASVKKRTSTIDVLRMTGFNQRTVALRVEGSTQRPEPLNPINLRKTLSGSQ